jgi:hypothetical protein
VPNPPLADGSACDAVCHAHADLFAREVLPQVFSTCASCHVAGGQAEAARFRVDLGDPLATARAVAAFVDSANPTALRVREKPLLVLPHGGGQQLTPGSAPDALPEQWLDLIAAAHCN